MLGRLRMSIDDAIKQYWILSDSIFRPRNYLSLNRYDHVKLEDSIKKVVQTFCGCHSRHPCSGEGMDELLMQYDYCEEGDPDYHKFPNHSCKV